MKNRHLRLLNRGSHHVISEETLPASIDSEPYLSQLVRENPETPTLHIAVKKTKRR